MRASRAITWARVRVCFGMLLLILFASGCLLVYASTIADRKNGHDRSDFLSLGVALIALSGIAAVVAAVLKRHLLRGE